MAAVYEIHDFQGGLLIRAKRKRVWTRSLFGAAITGIAALLTFSHILAGSILAVVVFLAVLLGLSEGFGQARAELRVTRLEFHTRGNLGTDFLQVHTVCSADIHWLEYQPESGGPDVGYRPGGLFAKVRVGTVCVLPLLDEEQTNKVIERITKRFPEMAKHWHAPSIGEPTPLSNQEVLLSEAGTDPIPSLGEHFSGVKPFDAPIFKSRTGFRPCL